MSRLKLQRVAIVAAAICVLLHPYIFGLKGRIAEAGFEARLHKGMSRGDVRRLALQSGGAGPVESLSPSENPPYDRISDGAIDVRFTDFATLCVTGGKWFRLYFAPDWSLTQWETQSWHSAC
jgi:hypothetical protein